MSRPGLVGQTLGGRYRVEEILGQGGMSAVYKAYDPNLRRVVAIKVIHTHLAEDPKFLSRFEEEATAVAQLRHPNIVQIFDFNHDGDLYYMVQEFVPGETLQERLRRLNKLGRRMSLAETIQYTINVCDAANYAHQRGMIHRDIKPANIMLDTHGQAILMDFGIVKIIGGQQHTATGAVVGTALYISPEMIRGQVPDSRSDLYSLGVTLFEMVSGRPPYEADSAMTLMMMHLHDPVPDLHGLRPAVPEDLVRVIEKSLAKERDQRFSSMVEMATVLNRVLGRLQPGMASEPAATLLDQPPQAVTPPPPSTAAFTAGAEQTGPAVLPGAPRVDPAGKQPFAQPLESKAPGAAMPVPTSPEPAVIKPAERAAKVSTPLGEGQVSAGSAVTPVVGPLPTSGKKRWMLWAGAAVLVLALVSGIFFLGQWMGGGGDKAVASVTTLPTNTQLAVAIVPSSATPSPTRAITTAPSATLIPTDTPSPTLSPTPTIPVGIPFARILNIAVDDQGRYSVDYETLEYTEALPGQHVHFFFNTVSPEQAGNPGKGPWILWGGPRPFEGFRQSDRPAEATMMCALVANPDHSIQPNSGNCVILPDIVVAAAGQDTACLAGPAPEFAPLTQLTAGQLALVRGISPDEMWWNVANPQNPQESCWLSGQVSTVSGDISILPLVQPPPLPEVTATPALSLEIQKITIDEQGRYVVEYVAHGYQEQLPGTHIHFYFNTVPPDKVGMAGGGFRLMFAGPTPFTGYSTSDRPVDATQLCALVANPQHSVIPNSGSCFDLPDVTAP